MTIGKNVLPLILGFAALAAVTAVLYRAPAFGAGHAVTGMAAGLGVAYLGFVVYFLLMPRPSGNKFSFVKSYLPGAAARYLVLVGTFCVVVFWLKINAIGVLLGVFAGMMAATFVTLFKMRQTTTKRPET